MNLHEYQAKRLLKSNGIKVLPGFVAYTVQEVNEKISSLSGNSWVVKAQIHAGGRGKAGGVRIAHSIQEVESIAKKMLGNTLITKQTGPEGKKIRKIYVEETCLIEQEYYLSLTIDRNTQQVCLILGKEGGVSIEEIAEADPSSLIAIHINPLLGLWPYQTRKICYFLNLPLAINAYLQNLLSNIYKIFMENDAQMIEINPLALTKDNCFIPLDAKIRLDENALFRHNDLLDLRDWEEESPTEREAHKLGLSYVKLKGNIGCMVNGAGLAMATLDLLECNHLSPANFLDVGGGADQEKVAFAFRLLLADPQVEIVFINIFGGIMRCDVLADGIVKAMCNIKVSVPVVVRLEGTNAEEGQRILRQAQFDIHPVTSLKHATEVILSLTKKEV